MPFKNGKYFRNIHLQTIYNAVSSVDKLSHVGIACFRHNPSASQVVSQHRLCMINQGINKPDSAFQAVPCNELLYLNQIFTSFPGPCNAHESPSPLRACSDLRSSSVVTVRPLSTSAMPLSTESRNDF